MSFEKLLAFLKNALFFSIWVLLMLSIERENNVLFLLAIFVSLVLYIFFGLNGWHNKNSYSLMTDEKKDRDNEPISIALFSSKLGHDYNYQNAKKVESILNQLNTNPKSKFWIEKGKKI